LVFSPWLNIEVEYSLSRAQSWTPNFTVPATSNVALRQEYDYIVVGSGAGGGPLAARLALGGYSVLVLEAGTDAGSLLQEQIPIAAGLSTDVEEMRWDYFVRHYSNDTLQAQEYKTTWQTPSGAQYVGLDPPKNSTQLGILYPRAGTLGGCAAHNAMITVYPHESDWNNIAQLAGDASWNASNMRHYFETLERNEYLPQGTNGHGFNGWLGTTTGGTNTVLADQTYLTQAAAAVVAAGKASAQSAMNTTNRLLDFLSPDINVNSLVRDSATDIWSLPLAVYESHRSSPRDFLVQTAYATFTNETRRYHLDIVTSALVSQITFNDSASTPRATGVKYLGGQSLYRADPRSKRMTSGSVNFAIAKREVIISAGTVSHPWQRAICSPSSPPLDEPVILTHLHSSTLRSYSS
jgi:choline dehydrogenase